MKNKKIEVFAFGMLILLGFAGMISAELEVTSNPISSMAIPELNKPAIFDVSIKNLGSSDSFTLYSIAGIDIEPSESISISKGDTVNFLMKVYPTIPMKISPDYYSFEYKIKGAKNGIQEEEVAISMVKLKDAFEFKAEEITPDSQTAVIHLKSKYGDTLENITFSVSSQFFAKTQKAFSLDAFEDEVIQIPIEKNKMAILLAGPYIINGELAVSGKEAELSTTLSFKEKEGISTADTTSGFFVVERVIEKKNNGNTKADVSILVRKSIFASLFTSFNPSPTTKDFSGLSINYIFRKEISPGESFAVTAKTNWWILIAVIAGIIIIWYLIDKYVKNKIVMKKSVAFVRTKGGEFALKVSIAVKARDFVEKIRIFDRLPPMVKVFERHGIAMPDKIDEKNRRLEWSIQALSKGETRELSYIIYSKIGVVGRFELPSAEAVYEFNGKIKEAQSNQVAYDVK